jgi:hypothetical protein
MNSRKLLITVIVMILGWQLIMAHPASDIEMNYDTENKVIKVTMTHVTKDQSEHFINKVVIQVNGKRRIEQTYPEQKDKQTQNALFLIIDLKSGDKIDITAHCNVFGKLKKSFTI